MRQAAAAAAAAAGGGIVSGRPRAAGTAGTQIPGASHAAWRGCRLQTQAQGGREAAPALGSPFHADFGGLLSLIIEDGPHALWAAGRGQADEQGEKKEGAHVRGGASVRVRVTGCSRKDAEAIASGSFRVGRDAAGRVLMLPPPRYRTHPAPLRGAAAPLRRLFLAPFRCAFIYSCKMSPCMLRTRDGAERISRGTKEGMPRVRASVWSVSRSKVCTRCGAVSRGANSIQYKLLRGCRKEQWSRERSGQARAGGQCGGRLASNSDGVLPTAGPRVDAQCEVGRAELCSAAWQLLVVGGAVAAQATRQLHVLHKNGHALGVDGAQLRAARRQ